MTIAFGATAQPGNDGFYFPADDARHARMWLSWPREPALQAPLAQLVATILRYEPVSIVVAPGDERAARSACGAAAIVSLEHQSLRLRDIGPNFLIDGKGGSAATDWGFSGWGERIAPAGDSTFAHALLGQTEVRRFRAPLQLESSCFVADGEGTILALAACVFDQTRNRGVSRLEAFAVLQRWLGAARVIWLERALREDTLLTDVRALAAFVAPGVVALSIASERHRNVDILRETRAALSRVKDARGRSLVLVELTAPEPILTGGRSLLSSYTSFVAVNGAVLVPIFDAPTDDRALDVLAQAFPGRAIEPVPARTFAAHGLTLTSLTLPQPARLLQRDRATTLPRSAWANPIADEDALLDTYINLLKAEDRTG